MEGKKKFKNGGSKNTEGGEGKFRTSQEKGGRIAVCGRGNTQDTWEGGEGKEWPTCKKKRPERMWENRRGGWFLPEFEEGKKRITWDWVMRRGAESGCERLQKNYSQQGPFILYVNRVRLQEGKKAYSEGEGLKHQGPFQEKIEKKEGGK